MNRIIPPGMFFDPNFMEVMHAHLRGTAPGQRNVLPAIPSSGAPPEVRPLQGIPAANRGASVVLAPNQTRALLEVRNGLETTAEMLTITVGAQPVNTSFVPSPGFFNPINVAMIRGNLLWGIGQATFQAFFDIYRGTTISIPASFFQLTATYIPTGGGDTPPFQIAGGVGYGSYANRSAPVRYTEHFGLVDIGGGVFQATLQIPPFAVAFTIQSEVGTKPAAPVDLDIKVTDGNNNEISTFQYNDPTNLASHTEQQYPLFNGSERIIVTNNIMASPGRLRVIYTLSL